MVGVALKELTEQQRTLVQAVIGGLPINEAAELAGYAHAASAYGALRSRLVQEALQEARETTISVVLSSRAIKVMERLLGASTPPATQFAAAKWVLERNDAKQAAAKDKPIHEMSEAELQAFIARSQAIVADGGEPPVIVVVPDVGALPAPRPLTNG